jgi:hypothetical protein
MVIDQIYRLDIVLVDLQELGYLIIISGQATTDMLIGAEQREFYKWLTIR